METKKITLATLKSFIKKHESNLFLNVRSDFDGMIDGMRYLNEGFTPVEKDTDSERHNLGIRGLWVVRCSRDYFRPYNDGNYEGIEISNCCQHSILAIKL